MAFDFYFSAAPLRNAISSLKQREKYYLDETHKMREVAGKYYRSPSDV